ncbi:MAG: VWA domain-containing protein [Candidatus Bathyarchaeia archaeon]
MFPFSAIVGLDKLKLAILINAINPKIGGLLIKGPKGSGKSTIVRALVDILPKINVVKDCPFNCNPYDPSNMCPKCNERYNRGEKLPVEEREMTVVDLPLGATEDRVIGSLDVEKAIKYGIEALEPGILAEANQNILYVDEVNLLPDHIADDLLDAAATGWNIVEREGISVSHPSRFIFIGTMNPEEGDLRPQLLDRFPLSATVERITSLKDRMEIVKRNMEFEADPEGFYEKYKPMQDELRGKIIQAKEILKEIKIPDELLEAICNACLELKVDGVRPDIVIAKAAIALAAFENRREVTLEDVLIAADLALSHRTREGGLLEPATPQEIREVFITKMKKTFHVEKSDEETLKKAEKKLLKGKSIFWVRGAATKKEEEKMQKENLFKKIRRIQLKLALLFNRLTNGVLFGMGKHLNKKPKEAPAVQGYIVGTNKLQGEIQAEKELEKKGYPTVSDEAKKADISEGAIIDDFSNVHVSSSQFSLQIDRIKAKRPSKSQYAGKRALTVTSLQKGKPYSWKFPKGVPSDIHLFATIRAAARKQKFRERNSYTAVKIDTEDVREKLRLCKTRITMVFVIDLSGSMLISIDALREALLQLHSDAYRCRDRVGIVALKGMNAVVVQHPTTNLRVVANKLVNMKISGYTPLAAGMLKALEVLKEARRRDPSTMLMMVLITDGSANVPLVRSLETGDVRNIEEVRVITRDYEDLAVTDAISASKLVKREGIYMTIINTNPHFYGRETYGLVVTQLIANITGGSHHAIGRLTTKEELSKNVIERIKEESAKVMYCPQYSVN